jgi:hypothetical protein
MLTFYSNVKFMKLTLLPESTSLQRELLFEKNSAKTIARSMVDERLE